MELILCIHVNDIKKYSLYINCVLCSYLIRTMFLWFRCLITVEISIECVVTADISTQSLTKIFQGKTSSDQVKLSKRLISIGFHGNRESPFSI